MGDALQSGSAGRAAPRPALGAALALLICAPAPAAEAQATVVDLELVLAVDVSQSVSAREFALQMAGYANAFRDRQVLGAIRAAGDHGIAVALVQWSNPRQHAVTIAWSLVRDADDADQLAARIARSPRAYRRGGTAIGGALAFCMALFEANRFDGRRRIVDLSGDGAENRGPPPGPLRDLAVASGLTINGLAIVNDRPDLDRYYEANVIGGSGAFVVTAADYDDFAGALVSKLVREIAGTPIARTPTGRRHIAARQEGPDG